MKGRDDDASEKVMRSTRSGPLLEHDKNLKLIVVTALPIVLSSLYCNGNHSFLRTLYQFDFLYLRKRKSMHAFN